MADGARRTWRLKNFIDSLTLELDRLQDTLAVKGVNRRLTYTVKDLALELQLFPDFDGEDLRFTTARPGESGAARISFQLGSITDRQIRESTSEPPSRDDIPIEVIEGIDESTKKSLEKVGVTSASDLARMERENIDLDKVSEKPIDYRRLAQNIQRMRRRSLAPRVKSASLVQDGEENLIVIEGERLAQVLLPPGVRPSTSGGDAFPRAFLNGSEVSVRSATDTRVALRVPEEMLSGTENALQIVLDPYAVLRMNLKPETASGEISDASPSPAVAAASGGPAN